MHSFAHNIAELGLENSIDEGQSIVPEITRVRLYLTFLPNSIELLFTESN